MNLSPSCVFRLIASGNLEFESKKVYKAIGAFDGSQLTYFLVEESIICARGLFLHSATSKIFEKPHDALLALLYFWISRFRGTGIVYTSTYCTTSSSFGPIDTDSADAYFPVATALESQVSLL